jgi:hypothetical protein
VFSCPCRFDLPICSWLCEPGLAGAVVWCAVPPLVLLCNSIRWRAAPLPMSLLLLRIFGPVILFRAYFALGGEFGTVAKYFERNLRLPFTPPLVAFFSPSQIQLKKLESLRQTRSVTEYKTQFEQLAHGVSDTIRATGSRYSPL